MLRHRFIPLAWAVIDLAVAAALLFLWHPHGALYWVRSALGGLAFIMGLQSLYFGLFAPKSRIERLVEGDFSKPKGD